MSRSAIVDIGAKMDAAGGTAGENKKQEGDDADVDDDDEVYQYPKAGLGPVFASMETLLRW